MPCFARHVQAPPRSGNVHALPTQCNGGVLFDDQDELVVEVDIHLDIDSGLVHLPADRGELAGDVLPQPLKHHIAYGAP